MDTLKIVVDTREQSPWAFPPEAATTRRGTLRAGDYSLEGDDLFSIERKSLDDFLGTISSGWERFERELERMADYPAKVIIVEGTLLEVLHGNHNHPNLKFGFVVKRVARLTLDGVSVLFAGNNVMAAGLAWGILYERSQDLEKKNGTDQGDSRADQSGESLDVPQGRHEVDDPTVLRCIGAKIHRQGDSGVYPEARGPDAVGR